MTPILDWLVLIVFSLGGIIMAHWVTTQSYARWTGSKNLASLTFLYALTLAAVAGISFVATTVFYNVFLEHGAFVELSGTIGIVKFMLIFLGVGYAALYGMRLGGKK